MIAFARRLHVLLSILLASPLLAAPQFVLPRTGIVPEEVGIVVNDEDPHSREIGEYYRRVRGIPEANLIRVHFPVGRTTLTGDEAIALKREVDRATPAHVQAYAVAWTAPYRAGCMSITSLLTLGFDEKYCSRQCGRTADSPYFNSPSLYPQTDHRMRPSMLLAGEDLAAVKRLIDRGLAAEASFPAGRAYLLSTADRTRSVRAAHFEQTRRELQGVFPIEVIEADSISHRQQVLFYFTGLAQVPKLDTLGFLPGALADHLTSFGGKLTDSSQMSSLRWLEAGASASYGTVVEPCNHPQKFPLPAVAMFFYASGATAVEAYWKSVAWPGEGLFIGDPLARPFKPVLTTTAGGDAELHLHSPREGMLSVEFAQAPMGPYRRGTTLPLTRGDNRLRVSVPPHDGPLYVRLTRR